MPLPPFVSVVHTLGLGGGSRHTVKLSGTTLFLSKRLRSFYGQVGGGACVCPVLRPLGAGHGCCTTRLPGESVAQSVKQLPLAHDRTRRGARGVSYEILLGRPRRSHVALHGVPDRLRASEWTEGFGACSILSC